MECSGFGGGWAPEIRGLTVPTSTTAFRRSPFPSQGKDDLSAPVADWLYPPPLRLSAHLPLVGEGRLVPCR